MKIPDELNDPNTWGAARVGAVAYVQGNVWLKTADGWQPLSSTGRASVDEQPDKLQNGCGPEYYRRMLAGEWLIGDDDDDL